MSFTQEQINNIIDLYVNQKLSCRKIAKEYQVGHGTISKLLKDNNVFDTDRPVNQKYTKQDIEIIGNLYSQCDLVQIYKLYPNLNSSRLYSLMSANNIEYGNRWTNEEIDILKNNYYLSDDELYSLFEGKRTICAIRTKCKKLNLVNRPMWSNEEIALLKEGYSKSIFQACKLLPHRSRNTIRNHAKLYNLNKPRDRYKFVWSKEEDDYLKDNWLIMSDKELSESLGRTIASIRWRRQYFNLCRQGKDNAYYSKINRYLRQHTREWVRKIKQQCNSTCCLSGSKNIHVHHYIPVNVIIKQILSELGFEYYKDPASFTEVQLNTILERFIIEQDKIGGVCIDVELHALFHKVYGFKNTKEQFDQFAADYKSGAYDTTITKLA